MKELLSLAHLIPDKENLCNFMHNYLFVGSYFLFVHVHSTFHRKLGLKHVEVEVGGACTNRSKQTTCNNKHFSFKDVRMAVPKNVETRKNPCGMMACNNNEMHL